MFPVVKPNCAPKGVVFLIIPLTSSEFLGSIVVSIPACHAGDRGSIPRRGGLFFFLKFLFCLIICLADFSSTFWTKLVASLAKFVLMDWEHFVIFRNFVSRRPPTRIRRRILENENVVVRGPKKSSSSLKKFTLSREGRVNCESLPSRKTFSLKCVFIKLNITYWLFPFCFCIQQTRGRIKKQIYTRLRKNQLFVPPLDM